MIEVISFSVLVALTSGVVEVLKRLGTAKKYLPLTSLLVGFILTLVGNLTTLTSLTYLTGIAVGLSAVGLFSQSKMLKK